MLLGTAVIELVGPYGHRIGFCALIDTGSQVSFISARAANLLHLKREPSSLAVTGISGTRVAETKGVVSAQLRSLSNKEFKCDLRAFVLKTVTGDLPAESFPAGDWPHIKGLDLADPRYNEKGTIDVLLGADVIPFIMMDGLKISVDGPMAQRTVFGWVLSGYIPPPPKPVMTTFTSLRELAFLSNHAIPQEDQHNTRVKQQKPDVHIIELNYSRSTKFSALVRSLRAAVARLNKSHQDSVNQNSFVRNRFLSE